MVSPIMKEINMESIFSLFSFLSSAPAKCRVPVLLRFTLHNEIYLLSVPNNKASILRSFAVKWSEVNLKKSPYYLVRTITLFEMLHCSKAFARICSASWGLRCTLSLQFHTIGTNLGLVPPLVWNSKDKSNHAKEKI